MDQNTNAVRGMVRIELHADNRNLNEGDPVRYRHLWYPLGCMFRLKRDHGLRLKDMEKIVLDEDGDLHYENIALLLAAGLAADDAAVTPEWILANIGMNEFTVLLPKVMEAIGEANGGNAGGAPVPPAKATGKK